MEYGRQINTEQTTDELYQLYPNELQAMQKFKKTDHDFNVFFDSDGNKLFQKNKVLNKEPKNA
ncbi:MAG TPA: hypothetical protein VKY33_09190 [Flavobacterium sp.]|nr:hypothetical protein [Flavobacterium sp.]